MSAVPPSSADRRTVKIRLTQKALGLREHYEQVSDEMKEIFYKGFSDEEIRSLETGLGKVLENLTKKEDHTNGNESD